MNDGWSDRPHSFTKSNPYEIAHRHNSTTSSASFETNAFISIISVCVIDLRRAGRIVCGWRRRRSCSRRQWDARRALSARSASASVRADVGRPEAAVADGTPPTLLATSRCVGSCPSSRWRLRRATNDASIAVTCSEYDY